jgi:hypothetical protein
MTCDWCGEPDAEPTPNGHENTSRGWINATAFLCPRCQREDEWERMERSRT